MNNAAPQKVTIPNIGISVRSSYGPTTEPRVGAQHIIDRAAAAEASNLDSLFLGDHHATPTPYYQNIPMMGRLLANWSGPKCGVLLLLPLWHPVLVAEMLSTLASLTSSTFVLQAGIGYGEKQFSALSADYEQRGERFEQSLTILHALWSGETINNPLWEIERAIISPTPSEPIATWIGATAPVALKRVARMGHSWLADPGLTKPNLLKKRDLYLAACEAEGTEYPSQMAVRRDVHVADSDKEAAAVRAELEAKQYRGIDPDALVIGTVGQVEAHFRDLGEIGFTDIITRHLHPDQTSAIRSIERLGHVRERFNAG